MGVGNSAVGLDSLAVTKVKTLFQYPVVPCLTHRPYTTTIDTQQLCFTALNFSPAYSQTHARRDSPRKRLSEIGSELRQTNSVIDLTEN
jgi:hypothetical protein